MNQKTSPLKSKPLRQPGQSVQERIDALVDDKALYYIMFPAVMGAMAIYEWIKLLKPYKPAPIPLTIITLIVTVYSVVKLRRLRKELKNLKLGRDGEKAVGQYLELLREEGCIIFHDVIGDNFNIDHVVISEKGVYLIETKTYSKPNRVNPRVHYKNGKLTIDGLGDKSNILNQVRAASTWLKRTLEESTGKSFLIKPVILFPGWMIDADDFSDIWVLEPKALPKFLANRKELITKEDKKLAGYHLSRYIRAL